MNVLKLVLYFSEGFKSSSCRKRCRAWYFKITMLYDLQSKHHAEPRIPQFGEAIDFVFLEQQQKI
ncbi:MAG TPA: hypothetical protein VE593_06200 [Nitrososphaeraceae archaeon]|nr:hypothetical protein [Nitrososphaeraceae archaeon]